MLFKSFDEIKAKVLSVVPGLPDPVAKNLVIESAIEFSKHTLISQETVEDVDLDPLEAIYDIENVSSNTIPYMLMWLKAGNNPLTPVNHSGFSFAYARVEGTPEKYVGIGQRQIRLIPAPSEGYANTNSLDMRVAYIPSPSAKKLDRELVETWGFAIALGARYLALEQISMPWGNSKLSSKYEKDFFAEMSRCKIIVERQNTTASPTGYNQPFF